MNMQVTKCRQEESTLDETVWKSLSNSKWTMLRVGGDVEQQLLCLIGMREEKSISVNDAAWMILASGNWVV